MIISTIIIVVIIPHHPIKHFRLAFLYISFEQCHIHTDVRTNIHTDVSFPKIASICWTGTLNCIAACWELTNDGWLLNANHCVWYTHALHSSSSSSHFHLIFICTFTFSMLSNRLFQSLSFHSIHLCWHYIYYHCGNHVQYYWKGNPSVWLWLNLNLLGGDNEEQKTTKTMMTMMTMDTTMPQQEQANTLSCLNQSQSQRQSGSHCCPLSHWLINSLIH